MVTRIRKLRKVIRFTKMNGSDNDFVVIDNRKNLVSRRVSFAKSVCQRRMSAGADGLILIETSKRADFKMRIFNPDGSEAEMCGNGARCAALFGSSKILSRRPKLKIETKAGILEAEIVAKDKVKLKMSKPVNLRLGLKIKINKKNKEVFYIDTGVPHTVLFVPDINKADVYNTGRKLRFHTYFKPKGTNVDFVSLRDKNSIYMRTYERGVESETLACGTGAVASAVIAHLRKGLKNPVSVYTRGGEVLRIYIEDKHNKINDVYLEGNVKVVYEGNIRV